MTPEEQTYIALRNQMQELVQALRTKGADYQEAKRRLVEAYMRERHPDINATITVMKANKPVSLFSDLNFDIDLDFGVPGIESSLGQAIHREIETYLASLEEEK